MYSYCVQLSRLYDWNLLGERGYTLLVDRFSFDNKFGFCIFDALNDILKRSLVKSIK